LIILYFLLFNLFLGFFNYSWGKKAVESEGEGRESREPHPWLPSILRNDRGTVPG
jgi:hypothetical protein